MSRQKVAVAGFGVAGLVAVAITLLGHSAVAATSNPAPNPTTILIDTMESELHRAMNSLGNNPPKRPSSRGPPAGKPAGVEQPKPYFLSYAVSDSDGIAMSAQFGAIVTSNESRRRTADVQVRLGTPAEDNTHGDHRNSALTTVPLPLTDDGEALARSLWFATNRGYRQSNRRLPEGQDRTAGPRQRGRRLRRLLKRKARQ